MKKFISFLLLIGLAFSLSACFQQNIKTESVENIPIGITGPAPTVTEEPPIVVEKKPETEFEENIPEETIDPDFDITLSFTGDMMLAAYTCHSYKSSFNYYADTQEPSYFLEKVKHIFEADDFTIVNLENVFTDRELPQRNKGTGRAFWFKSRTYNVSILTCSSVEGVSLANNHTYDFKQAGFDDTVETVTNAGLEYGTENKIMYFEKEGFRIAVICSGLWGEYQTDSIISLLKTVEENSDYQIVFYHGGTESQHAPEQWRINASRKLVDNGADLVLGNHPHVLQPREVYNGVEIIYSLGNFCYGGHTAPKNRTIIYQVSLIINKETLSVEHSSSNIIPCYVYTGSSNNYQPAIIENEDEINRVLDFMDGLIELPY